MSSRKEPLLRMTLPSKQSSDTSSRSNTPNGMGTMYVKSVLFPIILHDYIYSYYILLLPPSYLSTYREWFKVWLNEINFRWRQAGSRRYAAMLLIGRASFWNVPWKPGFPVCFHMNLPIYLIAELSICLMSSPYIYVIAELSLRHAPNPCWFLEHWPRNCSFALGLRSGWPCFSQNRPF